MADAKRSITASFGWSGFAIRWVAALVLVLLTYNPFEYSYIHWITKVAKGGEGSYPLVILAGLILLAGFVVYLRATAGSLGKLGSIIFIAIFGVLMWLLIENVPSAKDSTTLTWIFLFVLSIYLALGMTASFLWHRLTGQVDMAAEDINPPNS